MIEIVKNFAGLPVEFWVAFFLLIFTIFRGVAKFDKGWGIPLAAVAGTILVWYIGDAVYNDYNNNHARRFVPFILQRAWWQVSLFTFSLLLFAPIIANRLNFRTRKGGSLVADAVKLGHKSKAFVNIESQIPAFQKVIVFLFIILAVVATIRLQERVVGYFFPWYKGIANPWARGRIGVGFDAFWALCIYIQLLVASGFGLIAVFAKGLNGRIVGLIGIFLTWPFFILERTRNTMLAAVMPALLSWVFIKYRGSMGGKVLILSFAFAVTSVWFGFVLSARDEGAISTIVIEGGFAEVAGRAGEARHLGLNMYEELCYINAFLVNGQMQVNNGQRYFAEIVNPVPRALWKNKPAIGLDYAYARGFAWEGAGENQGGVAASISTGMIGQGIINFGTFFGPIAAALIVSFWVSFLAHLDFTADRPGHLPLYALGLVATFNLGRDITLLTLYPILFGYLSVVFLTRRKLAIQQEELEMA